MNTEYLHFQTDYDLLLSKKHLQGGDVWTTPDGRLGKGSPFSARDVAILLYEMGASHEKTVALAEKYLEGWRQSGAIHTNPGALGPICLIIGAARVLCYLGYVHDDRLQITIKNLLEKQHKDGGWRCAAVKMGRKPEWDASNPATTLEALDVFRFTGQFQENTVLEKAVSFLLDHHDYRLPLGPCAFGQGSLFHKTEFPFFRYNLFYYVYVLSFYRSARDDSRFLEAFEKLKLKIVSDELVIENPNRGLKELSFGKKGESNPLANRRYLEIIKNMRNT